GRRDRAGGRARVDDEARLAGAIERHLGEPDAVRRLEAYRLRIGARAAGGGARSELAQRGGDRRREGRRRFQGKGSFVGCARLGELPETEEGGAAMIVKEWLARRSGHRFAEQPRGRRECPP